MINYFLMVFFVLSSLGFLNLEQILTINLLLLGICRGIYVIFYILNYYRDYKKEQEEDKKLFSRNETIYFGLKQILIVLGGMLYLPLAIFISFYSLMVAGNYLKKFGENKRLNILIKLGSIIIFLSPIIGIVFYLFLTSDSYAIAAVGLSIFVYFYYGLKTSSLSLSNLIEKYNKRRLNKFPTIIKFVIMIILITFPTTFIMIATIAEPRKQTYMLEMYDGIELATDVYLVPFSFGAPRPVIFVRTPYGKEGMGTSLSGGLLYLSQDYHYVVQDIRGTHDSEGGDDENFALYREGYLDAVRTISWIMNQSWCNGKIASVGGSGLGIPQYFFAGMNPKGLVAQSIMVATPDLYKISMYQGGAFKEYLDHSWIQFTTPDSYERQIKLIASHPKKEIVFYNSTSLSIEEGPNYTKVNCSALHIGGWYDLFQQGTLDGYMGYDDLGLEGAKDKQLLIMGPNTHGPPRGGKQGELTYPEGSYDGLSLYLEWEQMLFDHILLGKPLDWNNINRVAFYMMGDVDDNTIDANEWRFVPDWPVPHENDTWYFTATNSLVNGSTGSTNTNFSYLYDPRDPVPTLGGLNLPIGSGPASTVGPYDQRELEDRADILIFETNNLTEPIDVIGHMRAHLYVKSNCTNTDFTVKICDVYPDGRSMLINDGIINAIRRDGFDVDAAPLNSVEYTEVDIDLWSTAYQFNVGHKIRITISSSNYPRFAKNPNTGAPQAVMSDEYLQYYIANNTILVGPNYPSYIVLPRPI
jgi:predicted acyl esterase